MAPRHRTTSLRTFLLVAAVACLVTLHPMLHDQHRASQVQHVQLLFAAAVLFLAGMPVAR